MPFHFHANQSHFHKNGFAQTEAHGNSEMAYSHKFKVASRVSYVQNYTRNSVWLSRAGTNHEPNERKWRVTQSPHAEELLLSELMIVETLAKEEVVLTKCLIISKRIQVQNSMIDVQ